MKLTLTRVYRSDKDKEGKPLVSKKDGRPYTKIGIKVNEYGDKWISGFGSRWNQDWKEGDTVEAEVAQSGEFLNLVRPDPVKALEKRVEALEDLVYKRSVPTIKHDEDWLG